MLNKKLILTLIECYNRMKGVNMVEGNSSRNKDLELQILALIEKKLITRNSEFHQVLNIYRMLPTYRANSPTQINKVLLGHVNLETAEGYYAKSILAPDNFAKPFPYPRENLKILREAFRDNT